MANPYFRQVPNFSYVSRIRDSKQLSQYVNVKNFFRRAKLRPDIGGRVEFFEEYVIKDGERPDNVAYKAYNDATLDWVVLISNNILNIQSEWPLSQMDFDTYLLEKYGSYENIYSTHHYETKEVKNSAGVVVLPSKLKVDSSYTISFYDARIGGYTTIIDCTRQVTNYEYEEELNNKKREIYILKPEYLRIIFDDLESIMPYKKGSTQYVNETLKMGDNIRLYE